MSTDNFYKELHDHELLERYKKTGDMAIIGHLYNRYMPLVYGVCLKYLKDREESKDAVMQVFEKLVVELRHHTVQQFRSWLYVLAKNYCLMQLRSRKGKFTEDITQAVVEIRMEVHPEDGIENELKLGRLQRCMEQLGEEQKACIRLFYLEQKCYKEISALTGFEDGKVKSYIQNGKRNLKMCMEKNE